MLSGIYKITCDKKIYIGSAIDIQQRWAIHKTLLNKNKHHSRKFQNAWNKYGADNFTFEILEYCDKEKLLHYEQIWLNILFDSLDETDVLNINKNAQSRLGIKATEETKRKISQNRLGKNLGNTHTLGRKLTDKEKENLSKMNSGVGNPYYGKKHTEEIRNKISVANSGKIRSSAEKIARAKTLGFKGATLISPSGTMLKVDTIRSFCKEHSLCRANISRVIKGKQKQYKGWKLYV